MSHLHTWSTPNGRKISIMLEEIDVPYEVHPVDIAKDEQFAPDFLAIAPNNKIPAILPAATTAEDAAGAYRTRAASDNLRSRVER